ncbi:MAG: UBP-type zinc finger domain-containing protein [Sandaracinaceae bacterium]|nr:UBP-type zinc finger domain-containing protein [Sandaracinaceae bacterium]
MACVHLMESKGARPSARTDGCEECLAAGDRWVHLRQCLECGHVGCCDDSKNKHASAHYRQTHHPVVRSFEPGETGRWCYADEQMAAV